MIEISVCIKTKFIFDEKEEKYFYNEMVYIYRVNECSDSTESINYFDGNNKTTKLYYADVNQMKRREKKRSYSSIFNRCKLIVS